MLKKLILLLALIALPGQVGAVVVTHTQTSQYDLLTIDLSGDVCLLNVYANDSYVNSINGEHISDMCQRYSAIAGINTDYFGTPPSSPPYSHGPEGMAYRTGHEDFCDRFRTSLAMSADNRVSIDKGYQPDAGCGGSRQDVPGSLSYLYNVVGGGPLILDNGTVLTTPNCENFGSGTCNSWWNTPTEHSAGGISADGRWLYLVTTRPGITVTIDEVAQFLKNQSPAAYRAMKFDGGGSAQMYFNGESGFNTGREIVEGLLVIDGAAGRHGVFVSQNITSTPTLQPGQTIQLSVTYQNDGVMPWEKTTVVSDPFKNPAYVELRSVDAAGNELANPPGYHSASWISTSRIVPTTTEYIGKGGPNQGTFTFTAQAPATGGAYTLNVAPFCRTGRIPGTAVRTFIINVAVAGANLSFETDDIAPIGVPDGWTQVSQSGGTFNYPSTGGIDGNRYVSFTNTNSPQWNAIGTPASQVITANTNYRVGFWYRTTSSSPFEWRLGTSDLQGSLPGALNANVSSPLADGEWHRFWGAPFQVSATQLASHPMLAFYYDVGSVGTVDVDGVTIEQIELCP